MTANPGYPEGTVTYVVADLEGSTDLAAQLGDRYDEALAAYTGLQRRALAEWRGVELEAADDRYRAVFASARDAAGYAVEVQRSAAAERWPDGQDVRVRIGLHTGEAQADWESSLGSDVRRAARIAKAGHGGQILVSAVNAALNERSLPPDTVLRDCGSHELKDLAYPEHLYQLVVEGLREDFPPLRTLSAQKSNLPTRTEPFIGRAGETSQVIAALTEARVVTLTGAAGIGKTSLAIRAAGRVTDQFADGVWLVDVSRLGDESLIPSAVAKALNISEGGSQSLTDLILSRLVRSSLLLVLDGCEHVVAGVRGFVAAVLADAAHVKVLVTSREALAMPGERVVRVAPLATPRPGEDVSETSFDSVSLFVDRAHRADREFTLDSVTAPIVAEICRRLDGLPLAIELAAAQLSDASIDEVAERLDRRFTARPTERGSGPRHETLGATLDWSYESLTDDERLLFGRLAVFSGGFARRAVTKVCSALPLEAGSIGEVLDRLVATSLVITTPDDPERYRLLAPIAQYARARLAKGEGLDAIRPRHAAFYLSLSEAADQQLRGPNQARWVQILESERFNLRAALRWSRVHDSETSLRLVGALRWFWVIQRDVTEGSGWLRGALTDRGNAPPEVVALALNGVGLLALRALDTSTARRAIEEAGRYYELAGDDEGLARQTYHLGIVAWFEDQPAVADELLGEAQRLAESSDDRWYLGWTLAIRGTIARTADDFEGAGDYLRRSHELFETVGGSIDRGWSSLRLGALARDVGDYAAAVRHYSDGRMLLVESADAIGVAHADAAIAAIDWLKGHGERALDVFGRVLAAFATGDEAANNLFELKMMIQGNPSASDLVQVAQWNTERAGFEADLGVKAGLAEYLYHLGKTGFRQGHLNRARAALLESLTLCREAGDQRGATASLIGLGCVLAAQEHHLDAVMLYAKAAQMAEADRLDPWPPHDEPDFEEHVAAARAAVGVAAFQQAWDESVETSLDAIVDAVRKRTQPA